eukprot:TRINITY_DN4712_c0_g1_i1.p1 TRINITY_DN4712_c0_g1~~TRINITY_DN4712_c0_g1_i1.p1  ORF type:complete len:110 (+),score=18.96 TRINITY_DN4712_c0_g1_i1:148-477(+)
MGRVFVEYLSGNTYCCSGCNTHIASKPLKIWSGFMGHRIPAILFREAVNVITSGNERQSTLSSGDYVLIDVVCRVCREYLGWKYLSATRSGEKYKEGTYLLEEAKLLGS